MRLLLPRVISTIAGATTAGVLIWGQRKLRLGQEQLRNEVVDRIATLTQAVWEAVPAVRRPSIPTARSVVKDVPDTVTYVRLGETTGVLTCAHVALKFKLMPNGEHGYFIDDGVLKLVKPGDKIYVKNPTLFTDSSAGYADCVFIATELDLVPADLRVGSKPCKATTLVGASLHGECHGVLMPTEREICGTLQGVASPGTSGTILFDPSNRAIGMMAGIDEESTALPVRLDSVATYSIQLARAMDSKRYAVVEPITAKDLDEARPLAECPTNFSGPAFTTVRVDGFIELPQSLNLVDLTTLTYGQRRK